jgi:fused signal recognition particle receptor
VIFWIIAAIVGAVVLGAGGVALRRRSLRRQQMLVAPPRAAMPDVLVREISDRPVLSEVDEPSLSRRVGASRGVFDRVRSLTQSGELTSHELDVVEEVLLRSDVGVATTALVLETLSAQGAPNGVAAAVKLALREQMVTAERSLTTEAQENRIGVWLFVGVNGVGKTTTIGKLAAREVSAGKKVILAAGDTFRAAAAEQLTQWAERSGSDIVRAGEGADPGSVVHDAIGRAAARGYDLVMADTAGRRHTSSNLLDELSKIRRVADREPGQVLETLLVLDATTGQNAVNQAREFLAAADVSGIVLTKLDGTARGGIVIAIEREFEIPVKLIGTGESLNDLIAFDPDDFVDALLDA